MDFWIFGFFDFWILGFLDLCGFVDICALRSAFPRVVGGVSIHIYIYIYVHMLKNHGQAYGSRFPFCTFKVIWWGWVGDAWPELRERKADSGAES